VELIFKQHVAGQRRVYRPGDKAFWRDADDARRLISAGYAEEAPKPVQSQTIKKRG
jgi:hypothetical protein